MADRVGIIDHGEIVAEDTPAALKDEIGRPTLEVIPLTLADSAAVGGGARALRRARERRATGGGRAAASGGRRSRRGDPRAGRRGSPRHERGAACADARRRLPEQDRPFARGRGRGATSPRRGTCSGTSAQAACPACPARSRGNDRPSAARAGRTARAALDRPHAAPAGADRAEPRLPGVHAPGPVGQRRPGDQGQGVPDALVHHVPARGDAGPGRGERHDSGRQPARERHRERLPESHRADPGARVGARRGPTRRRCPAGRRPGGVLPAGGARGRREP